MRAGRLTTPVTGNRATASRDSYGHDTLTFTSLYDPLMVAVRVHTTTATDEADGVRQLGRVTFTAAFTDDLDIQPRDQIVWEGDTYEVDVAYGRAGLRTWYDIFAVRLAR